MKKELEQKIFDRFKFYRPELSETVSLMCYGFSHGDGWFDIIWELSEHLERLIDEHYADKPDELAKAYLSENYIVNVSQVKEKFGTLSYYVDVDDEELWKKFMPYYKEAMEKSAVTCEQCGKPGKRRTGGWIKVKCDVCYPGSRFGRTRCWAGFIRNG